MMLNALFTEQDNYIKVSNESSPGFIVRYRGSSVFPEEINAEFLSVPFTAGETKITNFPPYAGKTKVVFEKFDLKFGIWIEITRKEICFPGKFCFNITGTFDSPMVNSIPCNNAFILNGHTSFNANSVNCSTNISGDNTIYHKHNTLNATNFNVRFNPQDNYIRVFNGSFPSFWVRYRGNTIFPNVVADFISLPFRAGEDLLTIFPQNSSFSMLSIQKYDFLTLTWATMHIEYFSFPKQFCFKVNGNDLAPQVKEIPCPN